jgi:polysaccharide biosynthesis protein PslG
VRHIPLGVFAVQLARPIQFGVVAFLLVLAAACAAPSPPPPTPTAIPQSTATAIPRPVGSLDYGIHMFIADEPSTTERDLRLARDGGFNWQKSLFQWRDIEGTGKGKFDWSDADRVVKASQAAGLKIIARLDFEPLWARKDQAHNGPPDNYQDYWDFVSAFVTRYASGSSVGRVNAIEVWNEPNLDREWGDQTINQQSAADYVRLLGGAYAAAHRADPNIVVLSAGLSPSGVTDGHSADDLEYLKWMYAAGLRGKFDALGAHANTQAPEVAVPLGVLKDFPHPSFYFRRIEQLRQVMVDNADASKQVWLTEWGWTADTVHPAYKWFAVSEDKKAANLVDAFEYARQNWSPWMGVMTVWTLPDPTWTSDREEYWWAITNPDGTPRPAYTAIRTDRLNGTLP